MAEAKPSSQITLLDGGMGREILRRGAPFRQPEWSALSLMEAPDVVRDVHESFAAAGSEILTTSNYAVVPFHIGEELFWRKGSYLTALSGRLAREAADLFGCRVAGCIPPIFGSYRPDLFIPEQAPAMLKIIIDALSSHVDLWLAETVSSIDEALIVATALTGDERELWISFTLLDGEDSRGQKPRLRSGESVVNAVRSAIGTNASAILFNCSQPEVMAPAIETALHELQRHGTPIPVGVYANAFPCRTEEALANTDLQEIREDLDPAGYLGFVDDWCRFGATIVGGCCGIGPEHIAALRKRLSSSGTPQVEKTA